MATKKTTATTATTATTEKKRGRKAGTSIDKVIVIKRHPIYPQLIQIFNGSGWTLGDPKSNWKMMLYKTSPKIAAVIKAVSDAPETIAVIPQESIQSFDAVKWLNMVDSNPDGYFDPAGEPTGCDDDVSDDDDFEAGLDQADAEDEAYLNGDY